MWLSSELWCWHSGDDRQGNERDESGSGVPEYSGAGEGHAEDYRCRTWKVVVELHDGSGATQALSSEKCAVPV